VNSAEGASSSRLTVEQVAAAFEGCIKPVWKSPFYVVGLLVVAAAMLLLPLIYLGLVGAVGYAVYYHATENLTLLTHGHGRGRARFLLYIGPLAIGVVLFVFMVKPFFARRARREQRVTLLPEHEPVLFAFVDRLCALVGAPPPRRVDVDCNINASASYRRGLLSLLLGRDLVLTIGAPLVAGMTLQQFAGVLAHEFGHFAQGLGMRLSYIIARINAWFARVVYERDAWDQWLIDASRESESNQVILWALTRLLVWIVRRILWVLMMVGHMLSCALSRQMEYDADRYEIRVAGSAAFESALRQLSVLVCAGEAVHGDLADSWKERRLGDNFPALLTAKVDQVPAEARAKLESELEQKTAASGPAVFRTHPTHAARIARARREDAPGIFRGTGPAAALFKHFDGLCKTVSFFYYQDLVGPVLKRENLVPVAVHTRRQEQVRRDSSAVDRYFQGCFSTLRPLTIDLHSRAFQLPPKQCGAQLRRARAVFEKAAPLVRKTYVRYHAAEPQIAKARLAHTLLTAGIKIDAKQLDLPAATLEAALRVQRQAEQQQRDAAVELGKAEAVLALRMECALALLADEGVAARLKAADRLRRRATELTEAHARLRVVTDAYVELGRNQPALRAVHDLFHPDILDERLQGVIQRLVETQRDQLSDIRNLLGDAPYPFDHAEGKVGLARFVMQTLPARNELTGTLRVGYQVLETLSEVSTRVMGDLAQIAERVETAFGLPPLPAPPTDPDQPSAGA
jgi:Zn-dependent protease with chaperone function